MPVNANADIDPTAKVFIPDLVNIYGCAIGADTTIGPFVEIQSDATIGKKCKISSHTFICSGVHIGNQVFVGHGVMFINDRSPRACNPDGTKQTAKDWILEETVIEDNVSIGSGAIVMCGVRLGRNCMIGAGAVVTKDVAPNTVVAGVPARLMR
ncbi:MAG: acyltransferase [Candidatus Thorarchaeota archaeon]|jgi:acetyltransferase-like isoleucine patch superfamily enzyme